eukprot:361005-Chlamydomonas_euryale.AAC.17
MEGGGGAGSSGRSCARAAQLWARRPQRQARRRVPCLADGCRMCATFAHIHTYAHPLKGGAERSRALAIHLWAGRRQQLQVALGVPHVRRRATAAVVVREASKHPAGQAANAVNGAAAAAAAAGAACTAVWCAEA